VSREANPQHLTIPLEDRLELTKVQADSLPKSVRIGVRNLKKEIELQIRL
jgi:hypothetical protein